MAVSGDMTAEDVLSAGAVADVWLVGEADAAGAEGSTFPHPAIESTSRTLNKDAKRRFIVYSTPVLDRPHPNRDGAFGLSDIQAAGVRARSRLFTQDSTAEREALPLNRWPSIHVALLARLWRLRALEPMGLLPEVQKGTMVLPFRS